MRLLTRSPLPWYFLAAGVAAAVPYLAGTGYYTYLATLILIYSIAAIGLNLLAGYAGQTSLAHASFMAIGAYGTALVSRGLDRDPFWGATGLHFPLGVAVGTVGAGACGVALAYPALRVRGPYLAMMTVAFGWIVWRVLIEWVPVTGGDLGLAGIPKVRAGEWVLGNHGYYFVVVALFLAAFEFQRRLAASRFGLLLRGVRHDEVFVAAAGIPVRRVKVVVFVLSSAMAGFAGGLYTFHQSYINPDSFQVFDSIMLLLAVLLGGSGTRLGPLVGTAVLVALPEALQSAGHFRLIIYGSLLILTLYTLPKGLVGAAAPDKPVPPPDPPPAPSPEPSPASPDPALLGGALAFDGIARAFGGVVALRGVSFQVRAGTVHALIGPNGAGKSTLINIATGACNADAGRILLDGRPVRSLSLDQAARRGIVRTFQHVRTLGELTVAEHILIPLAGVGRFWAGSLSDAETARRLLNLVGLGHLADVPAAGLPHGLRRLVDLARALAVRPRVLLLDEPAAGLAAGEARDLLAVLDQFRRAGLTVLLVEHNIDFVRRLADHVTVLDRGAVIADGPPADVLRDERVVASYLGSPDVTHG